MDEKRDWQRIKDILGPVMELDSESRPAYLDETCGTDTGLRREVESLLASSAESGDFIETPVFSASEIIDQPSPMSGRHFGNYEIIREIGSGGMVAVYLARRSDGEFEQEVALKIVRQAIAESQLIERFRRERQILASLNHPNIAKLLDGGVSDTGEPFLAMEYVEGETITEFVRKKNLPLNDILRLFTKVCSAVAYAHRNLVVHRDIKPGNILVTDDGEPKLLDFGLARLMDDDPGDSTQTQTAFRALTPAYASPEQLKGEPLTTASDIYSLGMVFYELITEHRPFHFEGKSLNQIIKTVTGFEPPPPSAVVSGQWPRVSGQKKNQQFALHTPQLKGDLDNIALMALRKEPERRYQSAEAFANDIERHLKGLPVSARPNTRQYRASKFVKRHKVGVLAASLIFLSLIGGITVSLWQTRQARLEKAKAVAVSTFMQTMLNASSPISNLQTSGHELTVKDVLDDASKRLAAEDLSGQPEVRAELQKIIGSSYYNLGQYDLAEQNLNAALETQTRIYGEDYPETLQTMVILAGIWVGKGDNAKANDFYRRSLPSLRLASKNGAIQADYLLTSFCDFAILRRAQGDSKEAELLLRESLSLTSQLADASHSLLNNSRIVLALTLADQGKFDDALEIIREESESIRQRDDSLPIERGVNLIFLGRFQMEQGNLSEAEKNLRDGEMIYRKIFSQSKLELGDDLRLEAQTLYLENKYPDAENKIIETLQIYRAGTSTGYINYPTALMVQGLIYSRTNRTEEAEKLLREAVRIRAEHLPETHFLRATEDGALGEFLTDQKRFAEAESLLLSSFESLKNSQAPRSPRIRTAARRLHELYTTWGKPEIALLYGD